VRGAALLVLLAVADVGCATGGRVLMSDGYQRTMLASSTALVTCDWGMTRWMPETGAYENGYAELNPLLGRKPSTTTIDTVFVVALVAHVGAYKYLPKWARAWWYTTVTAVEAANVAYFNPSGVCGDFGALGR
jgi:hypothetical protein